MVIYYHFLAKFNEKEQIVILYHNDFIFCIYLFFFRKKEGGQERARKRGDFLFIHSLVPSCMCLDQISNSWHVGVIL